SWRGLPQTSGPGGCEPAPGFGSFSSKHNQGPIRRVQVEADDASSQRHGLQHWIQATRDKLVTFFPGRLRAVVCSLSPETTDGGCMPHLIRSDERVPIYDPKLLWWISGLWIHRIYEYFSAQPSFLFFIVAPACVTIGAYALWSWAAGVLGLGLMLLVLSIVWSDPPPPPPSGIAEL